MRTETIGCTREPDRRPLIKSLLGSADRRFVWNVFAILIAAAANSRGRSGFGWFLLAGVISPLLAGLFLLLVPNLTTQALPEEIAAAQGSPTAMARIEQRAEASRTRRIAIPILALLAV